MPSWEMQILANGFFFLRSEKTWPPWFTKSPSPMFSIQPVTRPRLWCPDGTLYSTTVITRLTWGATVCKCARDSNERENPRIPNIDFKVSGTLPKTFQFNSIHLFNSSLGQNFCFTHSPSYSIFFHLLISVDNCIIFTIHASHNFCDTVDTGHRGGYTDTCCFEVPLFFYILAFCLAWK